MINTAIDLVRYLKNFDADKKVVITVEGLNGLKFELTGVMADIDTIYLETTQIKKD